MPYHCCVRFYPVLCSTRKLQRLNKRLKIFLNYFLGPVLFVWLSYSIYKQVQGQADLRQSWEHILASLSGNKAWMIVLVCLLMIVNVGLEAAKWYFLVNLLQPVSYWRALKATFSGQAIGFNSINRLGETASRTLYLNEGNRIRGLATSMIGNLAQIIFTIVFGLAGMVYMRIFILDATHSLEGLSVFWMNGLITVLLIVVAFFLLLYFRLSWTIRLLEKIPFVARYRFVVEKMEDLHSWFLTKVLFLAMVRYLVFVVQYVLLLHVFLEDVPTVHAAALVCVLLLIMSIIPTISLAELGLRGQVSIQLFSLISANTVGIIASAAGIWVINLVIPAVIGTIFLLGLRLFRNSK